MALCDPFRVEKLGDPGVYDLRLIAGTPPGSENLFRHNTTELKA